MSKLFVLILYVYTLTLVYSFKEVAGQSNVTARIFGGQATSIKKVPYLVQLLFNNVFSCGGTLISPRHVVTAAHCVEGVMPRNLTVVGGASTHREIGYRRGVERIFLPRKYRANTLFMDVAVIKLKKPMKGRNTKPISLCNSRSWRPGNKVQVSGWGMIARNTYPSRVHTMVVPLIGRSSCRKMYKNRNWLKKTMICAALPGRKDFCLGDSGGPLVYKRRLCGIVSWGMMGNGCQRTSYPGVYTNINVVKGFIRRCLRK